MDQDNRRGKNWHLEKTVSLSHIISTIVIAGSMFAYASSLDKRIETNSINLQNLNGIVQSHEQREAIRYRDEDLKQVNGKLDQILIRVDK